MNRVACVEITFVVDATLDPVIHAKEGFGAADQCERDRTAVRAEILVP